MQYYNLRSVVSAVFVLLCSVSCCKVWQSLVALQSVAGAEFLTLRSLNCGRVLLIIVGAAVYYALQNQQFIALCSAKSNFQAKVKVANYINRLEQHHKFCVTLPWNKLFTASESYVRLLPIHGHKDWPMIIFEEWASIGSPLFSDFKHKYRDIPKHQK